MKRVFVGLVCFATLLAWPTENAGAQGSEAPAGGVVVTETPGASSALDGVPGSDDTGLAERGVTAAPLATEYQRAHLGAWLEYSAAAAGRQRRSSGANGLVAGSIALGIGIGLYVSSSNAFDKGIGITLIATSSVYWSVAMFQLVRKSAAERRLVRWNQVNGASLTLQELGRFEGELRAQSEAADRARRLQRWGNFGLAMGGALMLGLTPVADLSDDSQRTAYIVGGVTVGVGLVAFGFSFLKSPESNYWKAYQAGVAPPRSVRWSAAPSVGRKFVGARLSATF
ncbi:MAG: hypothetical protein AAF500_08150 [Myxococcota bacterium]